LRINVQLLGARSWACSVPVYKAKEAVPQPSNCKLLDERIAHKRRVNVLANAWQTQLQVAYLAALSRRDAGLAVEPRPGDLVCRIVVKALVEPAGQEIMWLQCAVKYGHPVLAPARQQTLELVRPQRTLSTLFYADSLDRRAIAASADHIIHVGREHAAGRVRELTMGHFAIAMHGHHAGPRAARAINSINL
jgi:hypothetical protein